MNGRSKLTLTSLVIIACVGILGFTFATQNLWTIVSVAVGSLVGFLFLRAVLMYWLNSAEPTKYRDPNYQQAESTLTGKFPGNPRPSKQR